MLVVFDFNINIHILGTVHWTVEPVQYWTVDHGGQREPHVRSEERERERVMINN